MPEPKVDIEASLKVIGAATPAMETFADLKHSNAGIVLAMLGDGAISRGKCCEALAQLAHGVPFDDIPLPEEKGRQFSEDEIPAEVVERLEKELREARAWAAKNDGLMEAQGRTIESLSSSLAESREQLEIARKAITDLALQFPCGEYNQETYEAGFARGILVCQFGITKGDM